MFSRSSVLLLFMSIPAVSLLSGCASSFAPQFNPVSNEQTPIGEIQGSVHGGQAPVTGAQIYLYAAGTSGYKTSASSLLGSASNTFQDGNGNYYTYTDTSGNFALSGDYSCTQGQSVYMVAVGGNPGVAVAAPFSATGTFKNKKSTMTVDNATGITVGLAVTGTGIAVGTTVAGVDTTTSPVTITLSQDSTNPENKGTTVTFSTTTATFPSGSSTIAVADATGVTVGYTVVGSGVGGIVTAVSGTTVTLSQKTTSAQTSPVPVEFSLATNNTAIVQMAGLGQCPSSGTMAQQVPYLVVNEITTVAFAYAMAAYGTDASHIGSTNTASARAGLANAMANANNIVGLGWGGVLATANGNPNSLVPQTKIIQLADIVGNCVNQSSASSGPCTNLFSDAPNSSNKVPTDEATALFNIVHNPTNNASNILGLYPSAPVFPLPSCTPSPACVTPKDWTLPVVYNGVTGTPTGMAVDANQNVWISDSAKKAVVEIAAQGSVHVYTNGGNFGAMAGVAVNPVTGNIWASDATNNKVYILGTTGTLLTTISTGGLNKPAGIAFDKSGNGYVTNTGAYVIGEYTSGGTLVQQSSYPSSINYSPNIAVDYFGDVFVTGGSGNGGVAALQPGSSSAASFLQSGSGTYVLALDATSNTTLAPPLPFNGYTYENNVWTLGSGGTGTKWTMIIQNSSGSYAYSTINNGTGSYIGWVGGINPATTPSSMAFDGAGNVWVANQTPALSTSNPAYALSGLTVPSGSNPAGMTSAGFPTETTTTTNGAYFALPDGSGNIWVANTDGTVSQLLGMTTPVFTPLTPGKFATAP